MNQDNNKIDWIRLSITAIIFIIASLAIAYLVYRFLGKFHLPIYKYEIVAYLVIFAFSLVVNLSFIPLPFAISIMIAAAINLNPWLVALSGSLGACLGESSAYFAGYFGKKFAIPDNLLGYATTQRWIERYGMWAIAFLSFQPILPIEVGGLIAGCVKMPLLKFFLALFIGKFPKYLILIFAGIGALHLLPLVH